MEEAEISGIRACIFDAYGTLFDVHSAAARCRDDLGDKADRLSDIWRQKQLQYTWLRSLMRTHVDFWQVTGDALDYAMAAVDMDDPAMRQRLMDLYLELDAYAEVPAMLAALKAGGAVIIDPANIDSLGRESGEAEFEVLLNGSGLTLDRVVQTHSPLFILEASKA